MSKSEQEILKEFSNLLDQIVNDIINLSAGMFTQEDNSSETTTAMQHTTLDISAAFLKHLPAKGGGVDLRKAFLVISGIYSQMLMEFWENANKLSMASQEKKVLAPNQVDLSKMEPFVSLQGSRLIS